MTEDNVLHSGQEDKDEDIDVLLASIATDPRKKLKLLKKKMGVIDDTTSDRSPSGKKGGTGDKTPTLSGTNWGNPLRSYWNPPFPHMGLPFWWRARGGRGNLPLYRIPGAHAQGGSTSAVSVSDNFPLARRLHNSDEEEDHIEQTRALQIVEFDPSVLPKDSWQPTKTMETFLTKHFNRSLSDEERESILMDFPKPNSVALAVPKLDEQVKEHLKSKGKDPPPLWCGEVAI